MQITYRRTGGILTLIAFAAVAIAAAIFTVAIAAGVLITALAAGVIAVMVRAVTPARWRRRVVVPAAEWPEKTIETTALPERSDEAPRT